jgi:hypothetical protein
MKTGIRFPRFLTLGFLFFSALTALRATGILNGTFLQSFSFDQISLVLLSASIFAWVGYQQYSSDASDLVGEVFYGVSFVIVVTFLFHILLGVRVQGVAVVQPWNGIFGTLEFFGSREPWYRFVERGLIGGVVVFVFRAIPIGPKWGRAIFWAFVVGMASSIRPDVTMIAQLYAPPQTLSTSLMWTWTIGSGVQGGRMIPAIVNIIAFLSVLFFVDQRYNRSV